MKPIQCHSHIFRGQSAPSQRELPAGATRHRTAAERLARARVGCAIALVACLGLVACGGSDDTADPAVEGAAGPANGESTDRPTDGGEEPTLGGTYTYLGYPGGPPTWDPALSSTGATVYTGTANYFSAVYGYLVYEDWETGEVAPQIAESLRPTDTSNWVLKLRPGVTFTDGTPFDAEAVKYNWERIAATPESVQAPVAKTIASMTVTDPLTLKITLTAPNSVFDRTVAANIPFIGSPTALEANPDRFVDKPIGAGPFVLESYGADQTATLTKNPDYWDAPKPYVDKLILRNVLDNTQRYATFAAGEGDLVTALIGPNIAQAESDGLDPQFITGPAGGRTFIFNTSKPPFDDIIARKAFQHALDLEAINAAVYQGTNETVTHLVDEGNPFHNENATMLGHDPEEAQRLFDEYAAKNGGPMQIKFLGPVAPVTAALVETLYSLLAEYDNVELTDELVPATEYTGALAKGSFGIAHYTWDAVDPTQQFKDFYSTTGGHNFGGYSNPEVDQLLAQADATADPKQRAKLIGQVQDIMVTEDRVANVFLRQPNVIATSDRARGLEIFNVGLYLWDRVWLDEG